MTTKEFFDALFWQKEDDELILIWYTSQKTGRISKFVKTTEEAAQYALSLRGVEVYFGLGVGKTDKGKYKRYEAGDVTMIPAVWADLDLAGDAHKEKVLPTTRADVDKLLSNIKFKPDIIVNSGHGLHCYWLLKECMRITDNKSRIVVADLLHDWMEHLKDVSEMLGLQIDSVCDMARVLRVPGTINHKLKPVEVKVEYAGDLRGIVGVPSAGGEATCDKAKSEGDISEVRLQQTSPCGQGEVSNDERQEIPRSIPPPSDVKEG